MKIRKILPVGALGALMALTLIGCSSGGAPILPSNGATAPGETVEVLEDADPGGPPREGGRLDVGIRLDADELDPHKMSETSAFIINEQIYESLLSFYRGELKPAIAEEWEVSKDGMTLTFTLRDNAFFHSGRQVVADDVKYSLERIKDPETRAPRAGSYKSISSIEAPDSRTVIINLSQPDAAILTMLATAASSIVDRDLVEAGGLNGDVDGGSGPFTMVSRVSGQEIKLDRAEKYWESGVPYLDGLNITFNPDDNARAASIRSGTVDFLMRAAPEFAEALKADDGLKVYTGGGYLSLHLTMNVMREPFDDVRVRQAVFFALDRQEILEVANSGQGKPLYGGYLPPNRFGGLTEPIYGEPDLEKAKELLAEAGYPDGFDTTLLVTSTSAFMVRQAEVEQQQLAKIGINAKIEAVEGAVGMDAAKMNDFDMYQAGFSLTADPDERFTASFTKDGGLNYARWTDDEYEALIVEARIEQDRDKREELYQEAETILATRGPAAMTYQNADMDVVSTDVMGYSGDFTPTYRFWKYMWLDR